MSGRDRDGDKGVLAGCRPDHPQPSDQKPSLSLRDELLVQVMVLEGCQGDPIEILGSPELILIPSPAGQQLILIDDEEVPDSEDRRNQAITEDHVRVEELKLTGVEVRELGIEEEIFKDGETILDVLRQRNLRGNEVLRYLAPQDYNDLGYLSDGPHCR